MDAFTLSILTLISIDLAAVLALHMPYLLLVSPETCFEVFCHASKHPDAGKEGLDGRFDGAKWLSSAAARRSSWIGCMLEVSGKC